jgi:hypothetical protein
MYDDEDNLIASSWDNTVSCSMFLSFIYYVYLSIIYWYINKLHHVSPFRLVYWRLRST